MEGTCPNLASRHGLQSLPSRGYYSVCLEVRFHEICSFGLVTYTCLTESEWQEIPLYYVPGQGPDVVLHC